METKICSQCKNEKSIDLFDVNKRGTRVKSVCRDCCNERSRQEKKKHRERRAAGIPNKVRTYKDRDIILRQIGFENYRQYLASDLWKDIRRRVYAVKGGLCHICRNEATELHHKHYHRSTLTGKRIKYIYPVCHKCHEKIEFSQKTGRKNTLRQSQKSMGRAIRKKNSNRR